VGTGAASGPADDLLGVEFGWTALPACLCAAELAHGDLV